MVGPMQSGPNKTSAFAFGAQAVVLLLILNWQLAQVHITAAWHSSKIILTSETKRTSWAEFRDSEGVISNFFFYMGVFPDAHIDITW